MAAGRNTYNRGGYSKGNKNRSGRAPVRRNNPSGRKASAKKRSTVFTFAVVFIIVGIIFLIGFVSFNSYREYRKGQPFSFSDGVKVSGIDIGGLSVKEARERLEERCLDAVKNVNIKVRAGNIEENYVKEDFKYSFDFETPLKAAQIYSKKEQGIYKNKKGKAETYSSESLGSPEFVLNYKVKQSSIKKQIKEIAKKTDVKTKNAVITKFHPFAKNRFEYKEGSGGYRLDRKTIITKINQYFVSTEPAVEINAKVEKVNPKFTVNDLKKKVIGLATATSVSRNTPDGTHNMALALKACNGSVIEPGATWSFNTRTGDSNLESNGYRKAAVISDQKIEQGVGGGICQASTLFFEAGLFANMEIVERHNHYWASTYAFAGEDATIDYPDMDLRMRNKTKCRMFIESRMEDGNRLRVNIWGYQDPRYDNIRLHSENYEINKKDFNTRTFRELFKNGKIIKTEVICDSHYNIKSSVKIADGETFRTRVDGYTKTEEADYTPMEVVVNDDGGGSDDSEEENEDEDSENSDEENAESNEEE